MDHQLHLEGTELTLTLSTVIFSCNSSRARINGAQAELDQLRTEIWLPKTKTESTWISWINFGRFHYLKARKLNCGHWPGRRLLVKPIDHEFICIIGVWRQWLGLLGIIFKLFLNRNWNVTLLAIRMNIYHCIEYKEYKFMGHPIVGPMLGNQNTGHFCLSRNKLVEAMSGMRKEDETDKTWSFTTYYNLVPGREMLLLK